ncbi:hypothetical protein D3C87_1763170 [compost metagenome]
MAEGVVIGQHDDHLGCPAIFAKLQAIFARHRQPRIGEEAQGGALPMDGKRKGHAEAVGGLQRCEHTVVETNRQACIAYIAVMRRDVSQAADLPP